MSERAITDRVRVLGESVGLDGLSAHDCRHYWATSAIKGGTDIRSLQDAGVGVVQLCLFDMLSQVE